MIDYAKIIKDRIDPVDFFINQGLELGKASKGWRKAGLCCFHDDKKKGTFSISEKGGFKCFSCGVGGGDIIAFTMKLEGLDFIAACKAIASDYGLDLPNQKVTPKEERGLVGQVHQLHKIKKLQLLLGFVCLVNFDAAIKSEKLWAMAITLDCKPYHEVCEEAVKILTSIYSTGCPINNERQAIKSLYKLYSGMIEGNQGGWKHPLEIGFDTETIYARGVISFLKKSLTKKISAV